MSRPPNAATASATKALVSSPSERSVGRANTMPPSPAATSAARARSSPPPSRAQIATDAPSSRRAVAIARPMPRLAPATIALRPSSARSIGQSASRLGGEPVEGGHDDVEHRAVAAVALVGEDLAQRPRRGERPGDVELAVDHHDRDAGEAVGVAPERPLPEEAGVAPV